jgi:hypothetical protein
MGFYASWACQTKLQLIAKPVIGSGVHIKFSFIEKSGTLSNQIHFL